MEDNMITAEEMTVDTVNTEVSNNGIAGKIVDWVVKPVVGYIIVNGVVKGAKKVWKVIKAKKEEKKLKVEESASTEEK